MKKIQSTKDIPSDSVIRVYKKGFGYSRFRVIDNHEFFLSGFSVDGLYENINELDILDAYLWVENSAAFEFQLTLTGRLVKDPFLLFFEHTDSITFSEERKCLKAKVNIPLKYFIFDPKNKDSGVSTENVVYHNSAVVELSDREAVIITENPLEDNAYIFGHLALNDDTIEVIGRKAADSDPENNRTLIEFKGMHDKKREKILDYVFSVYRE